MNLRNFLLEEFFIGFSKPVLHSADHIIGRLWTFLKFSYLKYALHSRGRGPVFGPDRYLGPILDCRCGKRMEAYVSGAAVEAVLVLGAYLRYRCATFPKVSGSSEQSPWSYDAKGGQIIACQSSAFLLPAPLQVWSDEIAQETDIVLHSGTSKRIFWRTYKYILSSLWCQRSILSPRANISKLRSCAMLSTKSSGRDKIDQATVYLR